MLEQWSKIAAAIAIPVILAIVGYFVQSTVTTRTLALQDSISQRENSAAYVQLAVSILSQKKSAAPLRKWAAEVMNKQGPVPLDDALVKQLEEGSIKLPRAAPYYNHAYPSNYAAEGGYIYVPAYPYAYPRMTPPQPAPSPSPS